MNDRDLEDVDLLVAGEDLGDRPAGARQPFRLTLRPYTEPARQSITVKSSRSGPAAVGSPGGTPRRSAAPR